MKRAISRRYLSLGAPQSVRLVEVGPRDGLQNEIALVDTATKVRLVDMLVETGLRYVEATAFVAPKWVPQMRDAEEVMRCIKRVQGVTFPVLTPNLQGFERAMDVGATEVSIFASASEIFSLKNLNCSIAKSLIEFEPVMEHALKRGIRVRGYISCVVGCPYQGSVDPSEVSRISLQLLKMGCYEISLGDTIGIGNAGSIRKVLNAVKSAGISPSVLAIHCHDTYGQALPNILTALDEGVTIVDSSVAGLGGCPYAQGATGNVSTEDVVYMLEGLGVSTGVNLDALARVGDWISSKLVRRNNSKVGVAFTKKRKIEDLNAQGGISKSNGNEGA